MKYFLMWVTALSFLLACNGSDEDKPSGNGSDTNKSSVGELTDDTAVVNTVTDSGINVSHTLGLNTYSIQMKQK